MAIKRPLDLLAAVPATVAVALGAWAYLGSETGVDGTAGALLALTGTVAVTGALLLTGLVALPRGWRITFHALTVLGATLTLFAAWMLMQAAFAVAMLACLLVLLVAIVLGTRRRIA